jgi:hypothetical protein
MWLINTTTEEEGWHICQGSQKEPCDLLVFVKEGGIWRTKLWRSEETCIRAKNHEEESLDSLVMLQSGFLLGSNPNPSNYSTPSPKGFYTRFLSKLKSFFS